MSPWGEPNSRAFTIVRIGFATKQTSRLVFLLSLALACVAARRRGIRVSYLGTFQELGQFFCGFAYSDHFYRG
jgi:hypothetical protein